ncbi:hypothetical protein CJ030_MR3G026315 [Morella rubra]|uniref:Uncharacterized protein n=1 Tax=Morella rubra TaxID=262757 RepID=A0A6A1W032_9ROSI|nr:hypothetical protein CJ030_MR3G026315 [Morella rubra]
MTAEPCEARTNESTQVSISQPRRSPRKKSGTEITVIESISGNGIVCQEEYNKEEKHLRDNDSRWVTADTTKALAPQAAYSSIQPVVWQDSA